MGFIMKQNRTVRCVPAVCENQASVS